MQQAIGSFNGYFRSKLGNKDQFTLRQGEGLSDQEFVKRIHNFTVLLAENGWEPWFSDLATDTLQEKKLNSEAVEKVFGVESIKLAAGGEHPRWVVKGGNFTKYGITCWPETLEAAGINDKLDPMKENQPSDAWLAYYGERLNEDGRWVPDKVLRLERAEN
jgi:hypothetical protein